MHNRQKLNMVYCWLFAYAYKQLSTIVNLYQCGLSLSHKDNFTEVIKISIHKMKDTFVELLSHFAGASEFTNMHNIHGPVYCQCKCHGNLCSLYSNLTSLICVQLLIKLYTYPCFLHNKFLVELCSTVFTKIMLIKVMLWFSIVDVNGLMLYDQVTNF